MRILYFAWLRERIGVTEENLALPAEVQTVGELMTWLKNRGPRHAAAFASGIVRCAVDQEFVSPEAAVGGASEIAFFPPVTGG